MSCAIVRRSRLISDYAIARLDPITQSSVYRLRIIGRYVHAEPRVIALSRLARFRAVHQTSYLSQITAGRTRVTFITYRFARARPFFHVGVRVTTRRRNNIATIGEKKRTRKRLQRYSEKYDSRLIPSARLRTRCRVDFDNSGFTSRFGSSARTLKMPRATACKLAMQIRH